MPGSMSGNVDLEDGYFSVTPFSMVGMVLLVLTQLYLAARFGVRFLLAIAALLAVSVVVGAGRHLFSL